MAGTLERYNNSYAERRTIRITQVNTATRLIQGQDQAGIDYTVTVDSVAGVMRWPAVEEQWVVEKERGGWALLGKFQDDADPEVNIENGEPGDTILTGTNVTWGGVTLSRAYSIIVESDTYPTITHRTNSRGPIVKGTPPNPSCKITVPVEFDATRVTVDSTEGFASSGVIYIAYERLSYTSKTATTFEGITRGYEYDRWMDGEEVIQAVTPVDVPYVVIDENTIEIDYSGEYPVTVTVVG